MYMRQIKTGERFYIMHVSTAQLLYGNNRSSFYILTGKDAGYIGIDFDTEVAYRTFIQHHPEHSDYLTQKTKKGFHILFKYDKRLNKSCSNDGHKKDMNLKQILEAMVVCLYLIQ